MRNIYVVLKDGDSWIIVLAAAKPRRYFSTAEQAIAVAVEWAEEANVSGRLTDVVLWDENGARIVNGRPHGFEA